MRQTPQNEANILDEPQIEHAVGFVQHRHLNMAQIEHMLLEVVDDSAGSADQHVHAFFEDAALLLVVDAAEYDRELEPRVFADAFGIGVDLHGKFARRCDDDGARRIHRHVGRLRLGQQAIEQGDEKRRRLAGAGLRLARDVAAGERDRQGLRLNGRAAGVAKVGNTSLHGFRNIQGLERELTEMGV